MGLLITASIIVTVFILGAVGWVQIIRSGLQYEIDEQNKAQNTLADHLGSLSQRMDKLEKLQIKSESQLRSKMYPIGAFVKYEAQTSPNLGSFSVEAQLIAKEDDKILLKVLDRKRYIGVPEFIFGHYDNIIMLITEPTTKEN